MKKFNWSEKPWKRNGGKWESVMGKAFPSFALVKMAIMKMKNDKNYFAHKGKSCWREKKL